MNTDQSYLEPTQDAGRKLMERRLQGTIVMLNLLRFRTVADYGECSDLAPAEPITGAAAFQLYIDATLPLLRASGGDLLFMGAGGPWLIGPPDERWDAAMLVRQSSIESFIAFASDPAYLPILAHRTAALADSRLLPLTETHGVPGSRPRQEPGR